MLEKNQAIVRTKQVQDGVQESYGLEVGPLLVRRVMRKDMHMGYRRAANVPIQSNLDRCLVLRQ